MFLGNKICYFFCIKVARFIDLEHFFLSFFESVLSVFITGFLIKSRKLYFFLDFFNLHLFVSFCKCSSIVKFTSVMDIFAVDYPHRANHKFELTYCFLSKFYNFRFFVKIFVNIICPVLSIGTFFSSSFWLEREIWDMFGIKFLLNSDLRRILTDYGFQGHPLRKNFPLIGFVELRYDDVFQSIFIEPLKFHRSLDFLNLKIREFLGVNLYV